MLDDRPEEEILDQWVQATRQLELSRPYDPHVEELIERIDQLRREYQAAPRRIAGDGEQPDAEGN